MGSKKDNRSIMTISTTVEKKEILKEMFDFVKSRSRVDKDFLMFIAIQRFHEDFHNGKIDVREYDNFDEVGWENIYEKWKVK